MLNSKNRVFNPYFSIGTCPMRKRLLWISRVLNLLSFSDKKISFSLKLFSGHLYGQSFIKTVRGPFTVLTIATAYSCFMIHPTSKSVLNFYRALDKLFAPTRLLQIACFQQQFSTHMHFVCSVLIIFSCRVRIHISCELSAGLQQSPKILKEMEVTHNTLTLKAPPIICSRRQFQILPLFQNNK